jgi:hypothetical protein
MRWVDQGIGCSKEPDINNCWIDGKIGQHCGISKPTYFKTGYIMGLCSEEQVIEIMKKDGKSLLMDKIKTMLIYKNMAPSFDGIALKAAMRLSN